MPRGGDLFQQGGTVSRADRSEGQTEPQGAELPDTVRGKSQRLLEVTARQGQEVSEKASN